MNLSIKKITTVFVVLFLLSRTRVILKWFSEIDADGILTLQPLADQPVEARYVVTLLFMALIVVIVWKYILNREKQSRKNGSTNTKGN